MHANYYLVKWMIVVVLFVKENDFTTPHWVKLIFHSLKPSSLVTPGCQASPIFL